MFCVEFYVDGCFMCILGVVMVEFFGNIVDGWFCVVYCDVSLRELGKCFDCNCL